MEIALRAWVSMAPREKKKTLRLKILCTESRTMLGIGRRFTNRHYWKSVCRKKILGTAMLR